MELAKVTSKGQITIPIESGSACLPQNPVSADPACGKIPNS